MKSGTWKKLEAIPDDGSMEGISKRTMEMDGNENNCVTQKSVT